MRPEITGGLEEEARDAADAEGYSTVSEFVRDAVRRRIEEVSEDE